MECHRCTGVQMEDDGEWFICPCCRTRGRGRERTEARWKERAAELGMTMDEFAEHMNNRAKEFINPDPLPEEHREGMRLFVERMKAEWQPACEHDVNPWV